MVMLKSSFAYTGKTVQTSFNRFLFDSIMLRRLSGFAPLAVTCGALLSFSLALLGYSLLGFLFFTRYYAPASHHYVRPLHFDYTGYAAVAVAPLSPNLKEQAVLNNNRALPGAAAAALLPKSRFLPSGTQVAVHVCLTIPADHTDLFQVTGELLTNTTHIAARSSRTYINTQQPYAYRLAKQVFLLPLHVMGFGHGEWAHVDLPLFDAYEEREDTPVTMFRARLASRNASGGGLPPPPVAHAELHVRLRLGLLQTALFWLRPGLVLSVVLLLVGVLTAVGGTTGAVGLLLLAIFLRRWIAKTTTAEGDKDKVHRGALPAPPPRQKAPPFGSFDDALSYSLSHAEYYRNHAARSAPEVEDVGGAPFERPSNARASRRASAYSEAPKMYDDDTASRGGGNGGARVQLAATDSPGWSDSSGEGVYGGAMAAAESAHVPSRQGSGAESATSKLAASATDRRPGSNRPSPSPSPQPAADAEEEEEEEEEQYEDRADAGMEGQPEEEEHFDGDGQELAAESKRATGASGHDLYYEDVGSEKEPGLAAEEGWQEGGDEQEAGGAAGAKDAEGEAEGQISDLDPQADNEAAGAALRRRPVFAWKA